MLLSRDLLGANQEVLEGLHATVRGYRDGGTVPQLDSAVLGLVLHEQHARRPDPVQPMQQLRQGHIGQVAGKLRVAGVRPVGLRGVDHARRLVALGAFQHHDQQLGSQHGLAEEIVRSELDGPPVEIGRALAAGEDHDGQATRWLVPKTDLLEQLPAVAGFDQHLQQDKAGLRFAGQAQGLCWVVGVSQAEAQTAQLRIAALRQLQCVVDVQDRSGHQPPPERLYRPPEAGV